MSPRWSALLEGVEVPPAVFEDVRARQFVELLQERGNFTEEEARGFLEEIIKIKAGQILEGWSGDIGRHVQRLMELRSRTAEMYDAVVEHFAAGRSVEELPGNLTAEEFGQMFDSMNSEFAEIESLTPENYVEALDETDAAGDVRAWDEARQGGGVHEEAPPPEPEMLPEEREPREWGPGLAERERVERLAYTELMPEDPEVRAEVEAAAAAFAERWLPPGWRHWIRRVPRYGANEAAISGLAGLDPIFAAEGYEIVIVSPEDVRYNPDGVFEAPNGRGFALLEWKEPSGEHPSGYYASDEGRFELREDMIARARMAQRIPGCGGWIYGTGVPWMDALLLDIVLEIRNSSQSDLGELLMVPSLEGR